MSREIKFRVWDGKKMFFPCDIRFDTGIYFSERGWEILSHFTGELKVLARSLNNDKAVIMQYTGLKDKNGKDIYEGDIIKHGESIRFIEFNGCNYYATRIEKTETILLSFSKSPEVIGNIYENPELLK